jgi:hypothetical protein
MGFLKSEGKGYVVRHGAAAHRTDVEHQMAKLLGADHMVPASTYDQGVNHPDHHNEDTYNPHSHGGTSFQEHVDGKSIHDALNDEKLTDTLKSQWTNGDLHKLWALHFISNNADMHPGNFHVSDEGVKAFDSDHAFYEVPSGHVVHGEKGNQANGHKDLKYMPYGHNMLPSYLSPFVKNPKYEQEDDISPEHEKEQVSVKALNEHAKAINPQLFEGFGPHAAERAAKVKNALMSADPTGAMLQLWHDHSDKTHDLLHDKKAA